MSRNNDTVKHSEPIPIATATRGRIRSGSLSSASSGSATSSELPTPLSPSGNSNMTLPSPGSSPILSYFLAQSPTKSPGATANSFPFRKFPAPVFEEDEQKELPSALHTRRASTAFAGRFTQPPQNLPEPNVERGAGLLRRLSLSSGGIMKPADASSFSPQSPPTAPPNSAVSPVSKNMPFGRDSKPRRSATMSEKPRRAPSPMGERMLKGHFDGFN